MENLKAEKESVDEAKVNDAFYSREAEITELESLIPEIEEKIQDTKDLKKQSADNQKEEIGFKSTFISYIYSKSNQIYVKYSFKPTFFKISNKIYFM